LFYDIGVPIPVTALNKSSDLIGNLTRDLTRCSIMPQPTALPLASFMISDSEKYAVLHGGNKFIMQNNFVKKLKIFCKARIKLNFQILRYNETLCSFTIKQNKYHSFITKTVLDATFLLKCLKLFKRQTPTNI
jgi:hypothetical protein